MRVFVELSGGACRIDHHCADIKLTPLSIPHWYVFNKDSNQQGNELQRSIGKVYFAFGIKRLTFILVKFCDGLNACQCLSEAGVFVSSPVTHWTGKSPGHKVSHTLNYFHRAKLTKIKEENNNSQKNLGAKKHTTKTDYPTVKKIFI